MLPGNTRTLAILLALALGALSPWAASGSVIIPWLVATMLFLVFLSTPVSSSRPRRAHVALLVANVAIAAAAYGGGWLVGGREVALAGFFAGIAPTAAAAPVVVSLLGGDVAFVVAAFLISNLTIAGLLALVLPWLLGMTGGIEFLGIAKSIGLVVFAPMLIASILRRVHPAAAVWPRRLTNFSFGLWVLTLFLITAKASRYLRHESTGSATALWAIGLVAAATCAASFLVGHVLGRPHHAREASQSLGQKNTTFTIYLALAHASPLVALGPTFYVLWHNLWNAWNLHRAAAHRPRS
jgi:BASS family bile acid:Na+ symporter